MARAKGIKPMAQNKKAFHDYFIEERLECGMELKGTVRNVVDFGAFVDVGVHQDGLVHISKLANHRVEKVEDVVNIGDMIWVKVTDIDEKGRVNLSYKDALKEIKAKKAAGEPVK